MSATVKPGMEWSSSRSSGTCATPASRITGADHGLHAVAIDPDLAAHDVAEARDRLDELGLAVALDPGDGNDLTRSNRQVQAVDGPPSARDHPGRAR